MTMGGQETASPSQQGQGPKASCVRSSRLWVRTHEKARRDRRPRTAGLEVGNPEVVGPEHGWERGAGSCPGLATRWRLRAGNGGPGERGAAGPRKRAIWTWGPGIQPQLCSTLHGPPGPKSHPAQQPPSAHPPGPGRWAHPKKPRLS